MLSSRLPLSFLDAYSLSMSSLGCKALCMVINFLSSGPFVRVLPLSILRIVQSILPGQTRCLSLWWDLYCRVSFREAFSFVWSTLFQFFLSSLLVEWCLLSIFPSTCNFPFRQMLWFFLDLSVLFLPIFVFFHFSLWAWYIFLYQILFLCPSSIFLLFFFFFSFCKHLKSYMYIRGLIFSKSFLVI